MNCDGTLLKVDAWNPTDFMAVGSEQEIPVIVNAYMTKSGCRYSLTMRGNDSFGVEF